MREEAERAAQRVLDEVPEHVWDGQSVPVPVEDIVDSCFGLHVCDKAALHTAPGAPALDPKQSLSGLLLPDRREIWVDAEEGRQWPSRRRFTIGHELGHWILHAAAQKSVFCRHAAVAAEPDEKPGLPVEEREANAFAAALLMPAALVRRRYDSIRRRGGDPFPALCAAFGSSQSAMGRRLHRVIPKA